MITALVQQAFVVVRVAKKTALKRAGDASFEYSETQQNKPRLLNNVGRANQTSGNQASKIRIRALADLRSKRRLPMH